MRIPIDRIKDTGQTLTFTEPAENFSVLSDLTTQNECEFLTPLDIRLVVMRVGDIINVDGQLKASVQLTCDRCLTPFTSDLSSAFALTYSQDTAEAADQDDEELELSPEDMGLMGFRGDEIDFREGIQEQVVLALPLRSICSEGCKGLCAQCGADLNTADCTCSKVVPAGKFAALRKLKLKDDGS